MGIFTEKDETLDEFNYQLREEFKLPHPKPVPNTGIRPHLKPAPTKPKAKVTGLYGLHSRTGQWVFLCEVDDGSKAIRCCDSRSQPATGKVSIVWEEFSAFRVSEMTEVKGSAG